METVTEKDLHRFEAYPLEWRTAEVCREDAKRYGWPSIRYVPEHLLTQEFCDFAVTCDWREFKGVPDRLKTREMCLRAVECNGAMLEHVPLELRTEEVCLAAVGTSPYALSHVPEGLLTYGLYLRAVENNGFLLERVPERMRDARMCAAYLAWYCEKKRNRSGLLKYCSDPEKVLPGRFINEFGFPMSRSEMERVEAAN